MGSQGFTDASVTSFFSIIDGGRVKAPLLPKSKTFSDGEFGWGGTSVKR